MSIATFIRNEIFRPRLKKASVLAVYDPDRRYRDICQSMMDEFTAIVDASESSIEAREAAMLAFASLGKPNRPKELLVYVPAKPPVTDEGRQVDPFAVYAACGAIFPDGDGDSYESICLKTMPDNSTEIRRLFAECQSALDWDPGSAFKRDPLDRRVLAAALAPTEPVRVAEAARVRLSGRASSRLLKRQLSLPVSTISQ